MEKFVGERVIYSKEKEYRKDLYRTWWYIPSFEHI